MEDISQTPVLENIVLPNKNEKKACSICTEPYNFSTRECIKCEYCVFEACQKCYKTFVLSVNDPKCMLNECDKLWSRKFVSSAFPKSFINKELKCHREEVLVQQEIALLPSTQPYVEELIFQERVRRQISILREQQNRISYEIDGLNIGLNSRKPPAEDRRTFVQQCPVTECRGFLSTQWKCGLCNIWSCPECREVKGVARDSEHTCNPDSIASARLIASETKPCPKCSINIFKINGCDQMWCTNCNTGFNWRTGRIANGPIHNPHFFEWQQRTLERANGQPEDRHNHPICRGDLRTNYMRTVFLYIRNFRGEPEESWRGFTSRLSTLVQRILHIMYVILPPLRESFVERNRELRINYMRNLITKEELKTLVQRNNKRVEKNTEIANVYEVLVESGQDILNRIRILLSPEHDPTIPFLERFQPLNEFTALIEYINDCFREIKETYSCRGIRIDDNLVIHTYR